MIIIVAWQWLPFAPADPAHRHPIPRHASRRKRPAWTAPGLFAMFFFIILPHLGRAISVVIMIETIFLLSVFAEIYVTTSGGPGLASTEPALS